MMTKSNTLVKLNKLLLPFLLLIPGSLVFAVSISAQEVSAPAPPRPGYSVDLEKPQPPSAGDLSEKSIQVKNEVVISLCVSVGQIKINGWDRDEVRAFVYQGSKVGFSVLDKSKTDMKPVWIKVLGYDPNGENNSRRDECLNGKNVELDVPFGATIYIKSQESEMTIDSVTRAVVKNIGGDIFLNKVTQGIEARTYEGNVMVRNSGGSMNLETTNGNILAYDAESNRIGDVFKAKTTSGAVTLQQITFRETDVNTLSGSINFIGRILSGGQYYFSSANGLIALTLPADTSANIFSAYGFGKFESEYELQNLVQTEDGGIRSLTGTLGNGGARINFKTVNGKIQIKKQPVAVP